MCKCTPNIRTPFCGKIGCEWPKIEKLEHEDRIFEILNCYEVDARNIQNGFAYLDSIDARRLARAILHSIKENS